MLSGALAAGLLILLVVLLTGSSSSPATAASDYPPLQWQTGQTVVSLEFDDATADQNAVRSLLASHGMHATFYVNSGTVEASDFHMTWAQVHQLSDDGHEIAGHTVDHPSLLDLQRLSIDEARREICDDRSNLLALGYRVTNFAYPYGAFDATTEAIARECGYDSARNVSGIASEGKCGGCAAAEMIPPGNPFNTRTPENVLEKTTLATMQGYVRQAQAAGGGWVQLVFHHVCDACGQPYAITPANLAALLDWISTQPNTVVRTVQQVVGGPVKPAVAGPAPHPLGASNLLHNPSLEQAGSETGAEKGLPDCWDANGWGQNHRTWTADSEAHTGTRAEHLQISAYQDGGAMLLSHFDLGRCAPSTTPGTAYRVSGWYRSDAPVHIVVYTRDARGRWKWWMNSPFAAPSAGWSQIAFTTPPVAAGVHAISVGLGLEHGGSLTVDDLALTASR